MVMSTGASLATARSWKDLLVCDFEALSTAWTTTEKIGTACVNEGEALKRLNTESDWTGEAGDEFRQAFEGRPDRLIQLGEALLGGRKALGDYIEKLVWGANRLDDILKKYQAAQERSAQAEAAYNWKVEVYNQERIKFNQGYGAPPTPPGLFSDPAEEDMEAAAGEYLNVQRELHEAEERCDGGLCVNRDNIPAAPSGLDEFFTDFGDTVGVIGDQAVNFANAAGDTVVEGFQFARSLLPIDPYNIFHFGDYLDGLGTHAQNLYHAVTHPGQIIQQIAKTWDKSPGDVFGSIFGAVATGGATGAITKGISAGARKMAEKGAAKGAGRGAGAITRGAQAARPRLEPFPEPVPQSHPNPGHNFGPQGSDPPTGEIPVHQGEWPADPRYSEHAPEISHEPPQPKDPSVRWQERADAVHALMKQYSVTERSAYSMTRNMSVPEIHQVIRGNYKRLDDIPNIAPPGWD